MSNRGGGSEIIVIILGLILGYKVYKEYKKITTKEAQKKYLRDVFSKFD